MPAFNTISTSALTRDIYSIVDMLVGMVNWFIFKHVNSINRIPL